MQPKGGGVVKELEGRRGLTGVGGATLTGDQSGSKEGCLPETRKEMVGRPFIFSCEIRGSGRVRGTLNLVLQPMLFDVLLRCRCFRTLASRFQAPESHPL